MEAGELIEIIQQPEGTDRAADKVVRYRRRGRRARWWIFRWGCLGLLLFLCGGIGLLAGALRSGPVTLGMPNGIELKMGSDDTVLSNFTFQEGKTYYVDLSGNGMRNILELNYLQDSRSLELVLHHSTKQEQSENQLLTMKLP